MNRPPAIETVAALALGVAIGALLAWVYFLARRASALRHARRDALSRSQAVIAGKVQEQLLPYLPGFPFNPKDARFLGSPVDLLVFDGLDAGNLERVVFVEVKTGGATLSPRERQLRNAVREGRVAWVEFRLPGATRSPDAR
jgi:predicted Holliday junction resolvase-like endonuclease